jgi:hypothetical protein
VSPTPTTQIGIRLTVEERAQFEAIAKAEERSVSYLVKKWALAELRRRTEADAPARLMSKRKAS